MTRRFQATAGLLLWLSGVVSCDATSVDGLDALEEWDGESLSTVTELTAEVRVIGITSEGEQLARDWLRWSVAQPWTTGPINDATGSSCGSAQGSGPWFLAGTSGGSVTRECTIPANTELFFPLLNGWAVLPPDVLDPDESLEDAIPELYDAITDQHTSTCALTLRVDGYDVVAGGFAELHDDFLVEILEPFEISVNEDDPVLGSPSEGGLMHAVTAGYYVHLAPLSPGDHVVKLGGTLCNGPEIFETSVIYSVHVQR